MSERDTLFGSADKQAEDFVFDRRVVRVFPDMIRRSVPGYGLIVPSIALMARPFIRPGSTIFDLGCSLGAVSLAIRDAVEDSNNRIIAIDNSPDMVARFREYLEDSKQEGEASAAIPIEVIEGDILNTEVHDASVVVLNFTLQFIEPKSRALLLKRLADGLCEGGALFLSEKIRFAHTREQGLQDQWHLDFKRAQGYSELEIARKREALENTMKPESFEDHFKQLQQAGFSEAYTWFQCFNFASMIAIR